ncbi:hypothetical protein D033_4671A, partial [Vibrio parahaemolyticus B-265]|jgi:hypothetical protein
MGGD